MTARYSENTDYFILALLLLILSASSCSPGKFLSEDQTLLKENKIELQSEDKIEDEGLLKNELKSFISQEPTGKLFGIIPKDYIYVSNNDADDSLWYNRFARNYIGSPPAIYDHIATEQTAESMEKFLKNKKGFYNAKVNIDTSSSNFKTKVNYIIDAEKRYTINSITYFGQDTNIVDLIKGMQENTIINKGDPLDATTFDLEKARVVNNLQNQGYANFAPNYIDIKGDSTDLDHKVDIFIEIYPPGPNEVHQRYTIGEVNVYTDYFRGAQPDNFYSEKINEYTYFGKTKKFLVSPHALSSKIFLEPGGVVKKDERLKTFKGLSSLSPYRFVSMNPTTNAINDTIINFDIYLTAYQKKWLIDYGSDIFYSNISAINKNIIGYSLSTSFNNRNTFGGAEYYSIGLEFGQELELNPFDIRTISLSLQNSLQIPREVNLLGLSSMLRSLRLISANRLKSFKEEAHTNIEGGIRFQKIKNFLDEDEIGISFGYSYNPNSYSRYNIRQVAFNLNLSDIKDSLLVQIIDNPAIINSFEDYLITSLVLRDIGYRHQSRVSRRGYSWAFSAYFGLSGLETWLSNKAYNAITGDDVEFRIKGSTEKEDVYFAKFTKISLEHRINKIIGEKNSLASRIFLGVVNPFGGDQVVPFREQYGVGGPTSLRGWDQSELGPGGYQYIPLPNQLFYQKGDIRIECNLEYRFSIFKVPGIAGKLEGALFADAGNVWLLKNDDTREDAQISTHFYKQIAVAAGWGLRFDFDYFIIRFDFGYKVRNPYQNEFGHYWRSLSQIRDQGTWGFGNLQVGVGYAF